ncbi:MAG TPA: aspartyl protease family protein [Gemmatimonadales bacterium]|nr:aspartyl protease family protein [Gemmatimonadales bacterium]
MALGLTLRAVALAAWVSACAPALVPEGPLLVASLPLESAGGAIYVPAVVNGDSAWLMFDTGLSHTGLDRDWARTIKLPGADSASATVLDRFQLGELELRGVGVALYLLQGLSEASGRSQRGLLGHDVLQRFTVDIDYRARRVLLLDPTRYRYAGRGTSVPFTADADLPLVHAQLKAPGRRAIPARLLLDTGASGLCLILTTPFVEQHDLGHLTPAIAAPIGTGLAGDLHGTIVRLQELRLGGLKVRSPTTGLGGELKGFLGRTDIDGVIGISVFQDARLIVDYERRRIIVESSKDAGWACDYDHSGLRLIARGPRLEQVVVDYVVPRSPAADAGVQVGDELLSIDGRRVADTDLSAVRQTLREEGARRRLVLLRDSDTVRVSLQLRKLL